MAESCHLSVKVEREWFALLRDDYGNQASYQRLKIVFSQYDNRDNLSTSYSSTIQA